MRSEVIGGEIFYWNSLSNRITAARLLFRIASQTVSMFTVGGKYSLNLWLYHCPPWNCLQSDYPWKYQSSKQRFEVLPPDSAPSCVEHEVSLVVVVHAVDIQEGAGQQSRSPPLDLQICPCYTMALPVQQPDWFWLSWRCHYNSKSPEC